MHAFIPNCPYYIAHRYNNLFQFSVWGYDSDFIHDHPKTVIFIHDINNFNTELVISLNSYKIKFTVMQ